MEMTEERKANVTQERVELECLSLKPALWAADKPSYNECVSENTVDMDRSERSPHTHYQVRKMHAGEILHTQIQ